MNEEEKQRIAELEARIAELERCKHEDHSIGAEAVQKIVDMVMVQLIQKLQPRQQAEG